MKTSRPRPGSNAEQNRQLGPSWLSLISLALSIILPLIKKKLKK